MTTRQTLALLREHESRNVTFIEPDGSWPIVWERANGVHVWDAAGQKYLDLTAAFGVAAAGHANPHVVRAGRRQMGKLLHAMGDVHPHALKAELARELSRLTFERWTQKQSQAILAKTIFCNSGFEAVEAALKTAMLATGKRGVIAFEGAYHGLGYGALNVTRRAFFRAPFRSQLGEFGRFVPFPVGDEVTSLKSNRSKNETPYVGSCYQVEARICSLLRRGKIGAILIEPIQARGGINVPPPGFLLMLRRLCDEHKVLLILDEIYTGFGRTGKWFACEHGGVVPDIICLGKALTGGFPLSACVGRAEVMDAAWPKSNGEAIHTSTFLGHPVGCAMALAQIAEIRRLKLVQRSARLGELLREQLESALGNLPRRSASEAGRQLAISVRGLGLMTGVELRHAKGKPATAAALRAVKAMLRRGYILLPEGEHSNVISFTPPLTISETQLSAMVKELKEVLSQAGIE